MRIVVFGDWHGFTQFALRQLRRYREDPPDHYLHVGDFGVWPHTLIEGGYIDLVEEELSRQGRELWFVDGNHEHFPTLKRLPVGKDGLIRVTDHIKYIPRGHMWEWGDTLFMGMGGAISVDRDYRTVGHDYFYEEAITTDDIDRALDELKGVPGRDVDIIISHDSFILPPSLPNLSMLPSLISDVKDNRRLLLELVNEVNPKTLIHGHYHVPHRAVSENGVEVVGLGSNFQSFEENSLELNI